MRVTYVLDSLAPGGTEHSTVLLASQLLRVGVDVEMVITKAANPSLADLASRLDVPVTLLARSGFVRQVIELRRRLKQTRPDVLHTALFAADQLGRIAAARTGIIVISSFVNTPYDRNRLSDPRVKRRKLQLVRIIDMITGRLLVDAFHSVSDGVKKANARALHIDERRILVAERGRDVSALGEPSPERSERVRATLDIAPDAEVILNLGREEHQKGQVHLLRAMTKVRAERPKALLLLAGKQGNASRAIDEEFRNNPELHSWVRRLGHRSDIGDLLSAADALVISSLWEGTAGVALEALAMRTPIVSTRLEGLDGILVDDSNAVLVDVGEPDALASGLVRVLADQDLAARLTDAGHDEFARRFDLRLATDRMRDLYDLIVRTLPRQRDL